MATHFYQLKVKDIRRETADCVSIAFDIPEEAKPMFQFTQGQNITVRANINGEELRRSYSICTCPNDDELRVAVKRVEEGKFSSYVNEYLNIGDVLDVMPPTGKFYIPLNPANKKHYVAFAAGSGITPIISIIKTTLQTEPESSFTLVYGNRNRASIIFREELEALKNKYINRFRIYHILSREVTDAPINHGRINADKCEELFNRILDIEQVDDYFLCGPEEMIFSVKDFLTEKGVKPGAIHFELFTTPGSAKNSLSKAFTRQSSENKTSNVTIKLDGTTFQFDLPYNSTSILDAALKQGADLPYACKGGVCCTCRAKLLEGEVEMDVNYALEEDEVKAGFILTCQSHPRTEKIVVDFDVA
ncbi:MAG TPA: 1,2-phenylacetyl-CoA epoxidase subunit PaaE [Parasegetibacter sp.]